MWEVMRCTCVCFAVVVGRLVVRCVVWLWWFGWCVLGRARGHATESRDCGRSVGSVVVGSRAAGWCLGVVCGGVRSFARCGRCCVVWLWWFGWCAFGRARGHESRDCGRSVGSVAFGSRAAGWCRGAACGCVRSCVSSRLWLSVVVGRLVVARCGRCCDVWLWWFGWCAFGRARGHATESRDCGRSVGSVVVGSRAAGWCRGVACGGVRSCVSARLRLSVVVGRLVVARCGRGCAVWLWWFGWCAFGRARGHAGVWVGLRHGLVAWCCDVCTSGVH